MFEILIFGGTTEGRTLAEYCAANGIAADVSSATAYGAGLLPEGVGVLTGRLTAGEIAALLLQKQYVCVVDATHPYAADVTKNIRIACENVQLPYYRVLRQPEPVFGEAVSTLSEMTDLLNAADGSILSTLGSKSVPALTAVRGFRERIWLRLLPSETIQEDCAALGFDPEKLILARGPFDTAQNIAHIRRSGAVLLLTKESGAVGGYPEKAEAVRQTGIRMVTLRRPVETGYTCAEMTAILQQIRENSK